jgi:DNA-directed RNA polymerase alpha subunit
MTSATNQPGASDLPKTSQPAQRALADAGITRLDQLPAYSAASLLRLHGFGPKALTILRAALAERGLALAGEEPGAPPDR